MPENPVERGLVMGQMVGSAVLFVCFFALLIVIVTVLFVRELIHGRLQKPLAVTIAYSLMLAVGTVLLGVSALYLGNRLGLLIRGVCQLLLE